MQAIESEQRISKGVAERTRNILIKYARGGAFRELDPQLREYLVADCYGEFIGINADVFEGLIRHLQDVDAVSRGGYANFGSECLSLLEAARQAAFLKNSGSADFGA